MEMQHACKEYITVLLVSGSLCVLCGIGYMFFETCCLASRALECGGPCRGLRENAVGGGGSAGRLLYNLLGCSHAKAVVR